MYRNSAFSRALIVVVALALLGCQRTSTEHVQDNAALMSPEEQSRLGEHHALLLQDYDIDYRVVTATTQVDIGTYASESFELLGVGRESTSSRGLLLVIDPAKDQVRFEVSYSLEGVYTDAFVAYVQQRQMLPFFKTGRVADGILATTELIVQRAQDAAENLGFDDAISADRSGGVGAQTRARIDHGDEPSEPKQLREYEAGATPEETLASYFDVMDARDGRPELPIYTVETQGVLAEFHITPAQMHAMLGAYRACTAERPRLDGDLAVIRYPVSEQTCSPWFFKKARDGWRLDLATMSSVIAFGRNNAWRFTPDAEHPYYFAFQDWSFDAGGFPHEEPVVDHRASGPTDQY
ncbi:MAG: TPM domain-containing protein [Pseudomonadales bacterium]